MNGGRDSETTRQRDSETTRCRDFSLSPPSLLSELRGTSRRLAVALSRSKHGFTLTEVVVTIGLVAVLLAVYSITLSSAVFMRRSQYYAQAANFIQEELDSLRGLTYPELINRTNGNFLGVTLKHGAWLVKTDATDGQGRRIRLETAASPAIIDETGLLPLPGNYRGDFTFSAKIKVNNSSPSGWGAGLAFRYRDAENYYRFRFSAGGNALDRIYHGAAVTVWSDNNTCTTSIPSGTCWNWQTLEVVASGDGFTLKRNGALLNGGVPVSDATLTVGDLAIISKSGAKVSADDVSVTEGSTTSWNFEADALDACPADWQRLSFYDLPSGIGTLTIANYLTEPTMKQATVTIGWTGAGEQAKTVSGTTVIGQ